MMGTDAGTRTVVVSTIFCLVIILAGLALADDTNSGTEGILHYYTLAGQADQAGDNAAAHEHIVEGLKHHPTSPHLRLGLARARLALSDTAGCLQALESFADLGTALDLATYPPLAGLLEMPAFAQAVARLAPTEPKLAKVTVVLDDPQLWNEGIAWDAATGDLLAGSIKLGKVVRISGGLQSDLESPPETDLMEVIGLDVDVPRRLLWAATGRDRVEPGAKHDFGEAPRDNGVAVFDLETGRLLEHMVRSADADSTIHMWNDVSVAPDGTVYLTDMTTSIIWRVPPQRKPEVFLELEMVDYINGLAVGTGGKLLYVVGLEGVVVVDLATRATRMLRQPDDLYTGMGDGMAFGDGHLFIVQNSGLLRRRILHLRLTDDGREVRDWEALECGQPEGLMAYTCALGDGVLYVNGTAPFAQYDNPEAPPNSVIMELEYGLD